LKFVFVICALYRPEQLGQEVCFRSFGDQDRTQLKEKTKNVRILKEIQIEKNHGNKSRDDWRLNFPDFFFIL
jgi:hypothetical protein